MRVTAVHRLISFPGKNFTRWFNQHGPPWRLKDDVHYGNLCSDFNSRTTTVIQNFPRKFHVVPKIQYGDDPYQLLGNLIWKSKVERVLKKGLMYSILNSHNSWQEPNWIHIILDNTNKWCWLLIRQKCRIEETMSWLGLITRVVLRSEGWLRIW